MQFLNYSRVFALKHEAAVHQPPTHCLNCGAAVQAAYCQHCGQDTHAHVPGVGEYIHEFVGHYIALESKLWKTLVLLLFKPGRLTRDYIEGKRVRYVLPLRLYLTFSLVLFAVLKMNTHGFNTEKPKEPVTAGQQAEQAQQLDKAQADIEAARKEGGAATAVGMVLAQSAINTAKEAKPDEEGKILELNEGDEQRLETYFGKNLAGKIVKFSKLPTEEKFDAFKAAFFAFAPYAIFAMMPVFALYLKLLYWRTGRPYGEHLLFALHTNAFAFLMLILMIVLPANIPYLRPALGFWLAFYLPTAMRRVYGGSRTATALRWIVLMALHLLGMAIAVLAALATALAH